MAENDREDAQPRRPEHLSRYAEECLKALEEAGLANVISVGGGLGLLHYLDYRRTHDVDAWWDSSATGEQMRRVVDCIRDTLSEGGEVDVNRWGEVTSIELKKGGETVFSFQIARRSAQLADSIRPDWTAVPVDSLEDILASKMVALVERGAPRDFRDIYTVCTAGLVTAEQCWELWRRRQEESGSDTDIRRARLAVDTHLERIASQRPLEGIEYDEARAEAAETRRWFREEFLSSGQ